MQRKVSLHYSDVDGMGEGGIVSILEGQLDQLPPLSARVVRLFISSTFSGKMNRYHFNNNNNNLVW